MEQQELTPTQRALFGWWRNRAIMVTLGTLYVSALYFIQQKNVHFWQVVFFACWAISCWPQVIDRQYGVYCTLSRKEQKRLPRTASYWIANIFALITVSIPVGGLLCWFLSGQGVTPK